MEEQQSTPKLTFPNAWDFQHQGRDALSKHWTDLALCTLLIFVVSCFSELIPEDNDYVYWGLTLLLYFFVECPLGFGYSVSILNVVNEKETNGLITQPFSITYQNYGRYLTTSVLQFFIVFCWTLLLIVPGIVMSLAYAMTPYIMHENPDLSPEQCLRQSKEMMQGYKWKLFCLYLSFIGWILLGIVTLGIGLLWVEPHMRSATVKFYQQLKQNATELQ